MALLTDDVPVFSLLPFLKGLLHHMAGHAELRIILSVVIVLVSDESAQNADDRYQGENEALDMVDECINDF